MELTRHVCPPDHAHGNNTTCRSSHHCKCEDCTTQAREYEFWRAAQHRRGKPLLVPALGAQRRIRALQTLGWSASVIAAHAQYSEAWVGSILRAKRITPLTHQRVDDVYQALCMKVPTPVGRVQKAAVTKTKNYARQAGWVPPLGWDDIDDPNENGWKATA